MSSCVSRSSAFGVETILPSRNLAMGRVVVVRSEEHTSELQSLALHGPLPISDAVEYKAGCPPASVGRARSAWRRSCQAETWQWAESSLSCRDSFRLVIADVLEYLVDDDTGQCPALFPWQFDNH